MSIAIFVCSLIALLGSVIIVSASHIWDRKDVFLIGLAVGLAGIVIYYLSGEAKEVAKEQLLGMTNKGKIFLFCIGVLPWAVLGFIIGPLWKAFCFASVMLVSAAISFLVLRHYGYF
jgi:Na+/melibiose symporter-like transporter